MKYRGHVTHRRAVEGAAARVLLPIRLAPHVALRPRRCDTCGAPVLLDLDGTVLDDDAQTEHRHG